MRLGDFITDSSRILSELRAVKSVITLIFDSKYGFSSSCSPSIHAKTNNYFITNVM